MVLSHPFTILRNRAGSWPAANAMMTPIRKAGTRCLRWLFLSSVLAAMGVSSATAQEGLKPDERNKLDAFRLDGAKYSPEVQEVCDKAARWYAKMANEYSLRTGNQLGESWLVNDLIQRLGLPAHNTVAAGPEYYSNHLERKPFIEAFGKSLVTALEVPALQGGNEVVRISAARMIAEVCRAGYDGAAEVCLKIIAKQDENEAMKSEAVRFYALQGLRNLFAILPSPPKPGDPGIPEKTIFQKDNTGTQPPLERKSIQALIDYIFRQPAEVSPQDVDAILYIRREAVRALALVRVQQVRDKGKVECQPALALLRIARGDGLKPTSITPQGTPDMRAVAERLEAVIGFCNLIPPKTDRDMNVDYAVYHVGRAIQELAPLYKFGSKDTSIPWKVMVLRLREALNNWKDRSMQMANIQNKEMIGALIAIIDLDILKPIEEAKVDAVPNPAPLDQWLKTNLPKNKALFKSDEKSRVGVE
jgi:hypothetical protein